MATGNANTQVFTAQAVATMSPQHVAQLLQSKVATIATLEHQLDWFRRQLFGKKSERFAPQPDPQQMHLGQWLGDACVLPVPPEQPAGSTARERFAQHSSDAACTGCHQMMDPLGFGFENYDGIGRYREFEEGHAIDATGMVNAGGDANGPFDGAIELSERLSESRTFHACMTSQMFRFASGRIETRSDACSTGDLRARFEESGWDLRELIVGITQTDDFLHREVDALPEAP